MPTKEEQLEKKMEARGKALMEKMTNKDKRAAVAYFDNDYEDFDSIDLMVVLAWLAEDRSNSLEHYDSMPMLDLQKVILGE